ncbi:MAG TPA: hypothetical protein VK923_15750 [Euzebyales bacterium]|nr:hypothetical protein [Euzebyales bacterium]
MPSEVTDRLLGITAGRPTLAHDVLDAAGVWPHDAVAGAITGRSTWQWLLDHLTATLVAGATGDQRAALELGVATGYFHPPDRHEQPGHGHPASLARGPGAGVCG